MRILATLCGLFALGLLGCGEPDLEVKGNLDRVVGETVTFKLEVGDDGFDGKLDLVDSRGGKYNAATLKVQKPDNKQLSFVVPTGIAQGKATARVGRKGGDDYTVPMDINRLALALDDKGAVEILPLSPATLSVGAIADVNATGGLVSLTPSGGELAVLAQDQLTLFALGAAPKPVGPAIQQQGGIALFAVPNGALICTSSALLLVRYDKGQASQASASISGCRAVAADDGGTTAAVVHDCDSDSDTNMEDCVTVFQIGATLTEVAGQKNISLDPSPGAAHVAMRADGKGVVVADKEAIYGLWLEGTPKPVSVSWGQAATVVGIDRGPFTLGDLFVVADAATRRLLLLGFDPNAGNIFKKLNDEITLPDTPTAIAYGAGTRLYMVAGTKFFVLDADQPSVAPTELPLAAGNKVLSLAIQP